MFSCHFNFLPTNLAQNKQHNVSEFFIAKWKEWHCLAKLIIMGERECKMDESRVLSRLKAAVHRQSETVA